MPKRRALSNTEKFAICKKRLEPAYANEKLAEFEKRFPDENGNPVATSTLSDILEANQK
jgi:hypothetical protein